MKISKDKLKEIIKEELEAMDEAMGGMKIGAPATGRRPRTFAQQAGKKTGSELYSGALDAAAETRSGVDDMERGQIASMGKKMTAAAKKTNLSSGTIARFIDRLSAELDKVLGMEFGEPSPAADPGAPPPSAPAPSGASRAKERMRTPPTYRRGLEEDKK
jgi:hypothetical protein